MALPILGEVSTGFEKVRTVFQENFEKRKEIGASCCVYYKGEKVVDIWSGFRNKAKNLPWEKDTVSIVFSTTKGVCSVAFALLHSKGLLDYDEKVATYWPEFAFNGKSAITVRQLLAHQAGLFSNDKRLTYEVLTNEAKLSDCLAKQKPYWTPGNRQGYHAWTVAMYQNELCKRIDTKNRPLHQFFKEEIADVLNIDFTIGLTNEISNERVAELIPFLPQEALQEKGHTDIGVILKGILNPFSYFYKSLLNPPFALNLNNFNNRKYTKIPLGSAHGFGNARSLAQLYNTMLFDTDKINIRPSTLQLLEAKPIAPKLGTTDLVLHVDIPFSLGFAKPSFFQNFGVNYRSYGTFGAGGSGAFADPEKQIAYAYVMNKMGTHIANDPRELALRTTVYDCVFALEQKESKKSEQLNTITNL